MTEILKGVKVIELAGVLAGPAVGTFLAELGAEVIKIESPLGDITRKWKNKNEKADSSISAYFSSVNYGKTYLTLDLKETKDKQHLFDLVKTSDIVITNYKKGDDFKLGTDYLSFKKIKNDIIYASISGYGEDSDRTAFDAVLQAETGFMSMNGTAESGPIKMPVALIDVLAAHQLKEGILAAYIHRLKSGKGSKVSVSLYDAAIASLMNQASNYLMSDSLPSLEGSLHPNIAPYGETFKTSDDRFVLLAVGSDQQFENLCQILEISKEDKFKTNLDRLKNRNDLFQILNQKIKLRNTTDLHLSLTEKQIPHGIIRNLSEVFSDERTKKLLKKELINGTETIRVRNTIFNIEHE